MTATAQKARQTQSSFPAQPTGAVAECPLKKKAPAPAPAMPAAAKTAYQLTQDMAQAMAGGPAPAPATEKPKEKKAWIEIILVDMDGNPVPNVRYQITSPSGEVQEGRLNEHGQAGYYKIEPGDCKVTFPDLDKDAWE